MPNASPGAFKPKLATAVTEGYRLDALRKDALAGLTVAVVALPLSMAIAIASGVSPDRGLYAAIIGGFLVSALGGSRYQVGGPAGAFIVLVSATVARFGVDGLILTVFMSGLMLTIVGALRLGMLARRIPHPVTVGFTAGIAATIMASQLKDFLGLTLPGAEPGALIPKLIVLAQALSTISWPATLAAVGVAASIMALKWWRPLWPGMLIAVAAASVAAAVLHLPVETIGSRFGGIPHGLPVPHLPVFSVGLALAVLPSALAFTLLGAIESLLSAVVADGMTAGRHRSNMELVAQGIANMVSALFGGVSVTGTIARTATNIRAGAVSPVAGMLHAVFLLAFMVLAASAASYIPLAALAGLLVVVAWNMAEKAEFARLMRSWRTGAVLLATFGLTVVHDLIAGIGAGCALATLFWAVDRLSGRQTTPPDGSDGAAH
jgi:SulP family sulfate permease